MSDKKSEISNLVIFSLKSKYICEEERKNFILSRTFPITKIYDPTFIKPQTEQFINCFSDLIKNTINNKNCFKEYIKIKDCLDKNFLKGFPIACVEDIVEFVNC